MPDDIEQIVLAFDPEEDSVPIAAVLNKSGLCKNSKAARDVLSAGSVRVEGETVGSDKKLALGKSYLLRVGKKSIANVMLERA